MAFALIGTAVAEADADKKFHTDIPDPSPGDFFQYSLDMTAFHQSLIDESQGDEDPMIDVIENEDSGLLVSYISSECVEVSGPDCHRMTMSWLTNITLVFNTGSSYDGDQFVMSMFIETVRESTEDRAWYEDTITGHIWMSIDGDDYHIESIDIEEATIEIIEGEPELVSVGDTWTTRETSDVSITEKSRMNGGDWEIENTVEEWTNSTVYNAESIGNVFIDGESTETIRIKTQEVGSSEYDIGHISQYGVPMKMVMFDEDGTLFMTATLSDYHWQLEPSPEKASESTDEGLPAISLIATISILAAVAIMRPRRSI
jgi:hypothetical protein